MATIKKEFANDPANLEAWQQDIKLTSGAQALIDELKKM